MYTKKQAKLSLQSSKTTVTHTHILSVFTHQRVTKEKACMLQKLQTWLRVDKSSKNPNNNSGKMFLSHTEKDRKIKVMHGIPFASGSLAAMLSFHLHL